MAGEWHGRGTGTACYVWIGLYRETLVHQFLSLHLLLWHPLRIKIEFLECNQEIHVFCLITFLDLYVEYSFLRELLIVSLEFFYLDSSVTRQCRHGCIHGYSYCCRIYQTLLHRSVVGLWRLFPYMTLHLTSCVTLQDGFIHSVDKFQFGQCKQ